MSKPVCMMDPEYTNELLFDSIVFLEVVTK